MDQHTMGAKLLAGSALVFSTMSVHALPIQIQSTYPVLSDGTFHFLDNISANSFNFPQGLKQTFGAMNVTPNGLGGTTGAFTAIPLANVTPQTFLNGPALNTLNFNKFTVAPNFFGRTVDASAQNGPWTLGFLNTSGGSTDFAAVATPSIGNVAPVDHPKNVRISGSGNTPTFSWALPANAEKIDAVRVQVWDRGNLVGVGQSGTGGSGIGNVVYVSEKIPTSQTSLTLEPTLVTRKPDGTEVSVQLNPGSLYSLEISLVDLRDPNGGVENQNILSRTRSIFDFTFLDNNAPTNVVLPNVNLQNGTPEFKFDVSVEDGELVFIDPLVAIGYDYQIGANNPNFKTVLLPTGIGDGWYELYMWDNGAWVKLADIEGGTTYDFGANGVDRFRVLGIETGAGLSPEDPTAFITGLQFVGAGVFTGTMTAVTVEVPEPGSQALAGLALALLAMRRGGRGAQGS
ncbi:MAG: PEP-CTERM sorting domain-containing protein [Azonexus sp.]|nr:PEP-CTERM sorting domain-containing protein [Azonexus sp.]